MSDKSLTPSTLPALDFARGMMATLVFLSHAALLTGAVGDLRHLFRLGGVAVEIFMFISGFLMLWHFQLRETKEPWNKMTTWRAFWVRRFFRMAPLYWVLLVIIYAFHQPLQDFHHQIHETFPLPWAGREVDPGRIDSSLSAGNILAHFSFVFGIIPKWASNNLLPDWSITLEMQFYLLFPLLAMMMKRVGWLLLTIAVLILWQLFAFNTGVGLLANSGPWGWFPMPTILPLRIAVFLSGMLAAWGLARWYQSGKGLPEMLVAVGIGLWGDYLLALFIIGFLAWQCTSRSPRFTQWFPIRMVHSLFSSRIIRLFADASYGIYLCHMLVLLAVMWLLLSNQAFIDDSPIKRFLIVSALSLPPVFGLSLACHRWIEKPGIELGRKIVNKLPRN